jgi:hypothetical protein
LLFFSDIRQVSRAEELDKQKAGDADEKKNKE